MKVRGGRRRHGQRQPQSIEGLFARVGEAAAAVVEMFAEVGRAWGQILTDALELVRGEAQREEADSMHELGEELGLARDVVEDIIADTRTYTPCSPADWRIARIHLAELAGRTAVTW